MNIRNRRQFLKHGGSGLGAMAFSSMLAAERNTAPHHTPKAKSVIFLFMEGGPSHIDLFDPKPKLNELHGKPLPPSFGKLITAMGTGNNSLLGSPRKWQQRWLAQLRLFSLVS